MCSPTRRTSSTTSSTSTTSSYFLGLYDSDSDSEDWKGRRERVDDMQQITRGRVQTWVGCGKAVLLVLPKTVVVVVVVNIGVVDKRHLSLWHLSCTCMRICVHDKCY